VRLRRLDHERVQRRQLVAADLPDVAVGIAHVDAGFVRHRHLAFGDDHVPVADQRVDAEDRRLLRPLRHELPDRVLALDRRLADHGPDEVVGAAGQERLDIAAPHRLVHVFDDGLVLR
jgi:hypothetical protein